MLTANNLIKTFEKHEKKQKKVSFNAVDDISLQVGQGEIVGVLGPNGAGKTTLLRMLGMLMQPTSGSITMTVDGEQLTDVTRIKANIGYLSGNTKLYGRLSTRELLEILGNIYGMDKQAIDERIEAISKVLNLENFIDNRIEKLSTGQTQRASISRCLIHSPKLYIFDEPTLGLDIISSNSIIEFMKQERQQGKTVLYSTHYMEEAEYLCDRVVLIDKGRIVAQGTIDELSQLTGKNKLRDIFNSLIKEVE
ncbi:MAG: ATP-binding cassette domain-containing protein [Lachnospiraceae bacterium]|nr:ATP-binding cassette domain-containing protein [Lachnospiraceae bacterium]